MYISSEMSDTISAISTPVGIGGIGIIRISGDRAIEIADRLFRGRKKIREMKGYTAAYGWVVDPATDEAVDSVVILVMRAPHSYTGEDVVEISAHGGQLVLNRILKLTLAEGARIAEPGEFTKRAFLNGKLDLSQAEAVANLIYANNMAALRATGRQLEGSLGRRIKEVRRELIDVVALIEVGNDYYEEDLPLVESAHVKSVVSRVLSLIERWLKDYEDATPVREGINMVIVGKPNVGKSSIMNSILKKERSIVTSVAGTTRDTVEDTVVIEGVLFRSVDTAGIRLTEDEVELLGVDRSRKAIKLADLVLFVVDASIPLDSNDYLVRDEIFRNSSGKILGVYNKIDLSLKILPSELDSFINIKWVGVSALTGEGMKMLEKAIFETVMPADSFLGSEFSFSTPRIASLLKETARALRSGINSIDMKRPLDIVSIDIREAITSLSKIIGEGDVSEEVIDAVFSNFCVGK